MNKKFAVIPLLVMSAFASANETPEQTQLQEVVVKAKGVKSFSIASDGDLRDRVNLSLLGKANAFTAPITVVNYDEQVIEKSQERTLVDAVAKRDASTWQFGGESNTLTGLYFRGFQLDARQFSVNGLAGMYGTQGTSSVQVASAQLIKGASTAVTGMDPEGAVSGALNIETKKASDEGDRKIGLAYFSDNRPQVNVDLGQRFGADKQFGVRVNGLMRQGDTPRENHEEKNREFSINADYRGENLRVAFDSFYANRFVAGGRGRIQDIQNLNAQLFTAPDGSVNLSPKWQSTKTRSQTNMLTFEYDVSDNFQITGGIGHNDARYYGNFASPTATSANTVSRTGRVTRVGTNGNPNLFDPGRSRLTDQRFQTSSFNLSGRGYFETGPVSHNWSVALDRIDRRRQTIRGARQTTAGANIDVTQDIATQLAALPSDLGTEWEASANLDTKVLANSVAASDTLGFANNRYRLTLGGRFQQVEQKDNIDATKVSANRFSPMLMAAWVPNPNLVVYGNYMEDLEPGAVDSDTGEMSEPKVSRQFEVGVRKNWGDVVTSFNVFQIKRPGYWRGNTTATSALAGKVQGYELNRGAEFNVYGNFLNKTLRPNFGLMYLKSTVHDFPTYADILVDGVQVSAPRIVAKAGVEWDVPQTHGLTLNAQVQHMGKSYQRTDKAFAFPSYTLVDVGARYVGKLADKQKITISGSVENVFNKNYWQVQRGQYDRSFAVVGMPRTYWLKAEYSF
ncbi:MAG: TonB-dependent siderophore receptor [Neisseria sp.]|nr:TonB-dependent siderophore receptor [Neisseria sp.]